MGFLDSIFGKKKKKKQSAKQKQKQKSKPKQEKQNVTIMNDPLVTLTSEVTAVNYAIKDLKRAMHDDHHRILGEFDQLPKHDDIKDILNSKKDRLEREKSRIEKEIEVTELQKEIIEHLETPKSAAEVAEKLNKSRTWVSQQMAKLLENGMVDSKKEGKYVKYFLPSADTEQ